MALEDLDLRGSRLSGRGLAQLAALARLKHLDLSNTAVDDAGLAESAVPAGTGVVGCSTRRRSATRPSAASAIFPNFAA